MVLRCGDKMMRCHTMVLRARSPVLGRLLGAARGPLVNLRLDAMETGALEVAVCYMYTGKLERKRGVALVKMVSVAARLEVPGLLRSLELELSRAGVREVLEVLVEAQALGLEQLVVRAVGRINRGRVVLVKDSWWRNKMLAHPAALLRVYQALSEKEEGEGDEGAGLRACFSCGASSRGLYCSWCSYRK